ncbi:CLUMA_CG015825, isoform A [Clunio marinus]|uniref:CLUMA_CG015825, isoform A n=1 Tax=Clunio marinus TaxID=568069 RepID=A0A1J1IRJ7_9DIPT|nr:CLUMA_CG015825, isoform A [Clunio marinus]
MTTLFWMDFSDDSYNRTTLWRMLVFFILYVSCYKLLRKKLKESPEYCCRLVTFAHGLIASTVSCCYIMLPALGYYKVDSIPSPFILSHSMGFFMFDLFWCFAHGETWVMYFHHILTVTGLFYYLFKLEKQYFIVYAIGLTEFTNPLLQTRWFLKHYDMRDTWTFKIVEYLFFISFYAIRLIVLSYYSYEGWFNESLGFTTDDLIFTTLGALTGYALAYQMASYIVYQVKKTRKEEQEEQKLKEQ